MNFNSNQPFIFLKNCIFILFFCFNQSIFGQEGNINAADTASQLPDTLPLTIKSDTISDSTINDTAKVPSSKTLKDTIQYEADVIEYDIKKKIILLRGNGIVRYKKMVLYADSIHLLFDEDMLVATGHPQLIEEADTVVGENMVYNLKTGRGKVRYGTAHSAGSKYDGFQIIRSDDESFYIEDGDYTSCAVIDSPHYCFYGKHIKVTPNDKVISRPIVLNIADAPVVILPYFIIPLERGRKSGWLSPRWGGNPTRGGFLDNVGYYLAPNDYADYTLAGKVSEFQSYVLRTNTNYRLLYWFNGGLSGRYALDNFAERKNKRWEFNYRHKQFILPDHSMDLTGSGKIVSDKDFYRLHSLDTTELLKQQQTDANMSLSKRFNKINAYGNINWNRNHNFKSNTVTQDLPSFSFTLSPRALVPYDNDNNTFTGTDTDIDEEKEKWYNKIRYSYSASGKQNYIQTSKGEDDEKTRHHAGIVHNLDLSATQKIFKWFNLTPNFNIHQSVIDAYIDTSKILDTICTPRDTIVPITSKVDTSIIKTKIDTIIVGDTLKLKYQIGIDTTIHQIQDTTYWWQDDFSLRKAQTYWWNTGASISTNLYGIFPIKIFNFTGMRHTLSPSVSYTFTPKKDVDVTYPSVVPFASPKLKRSQVVGFHIHNTFQGRAKFKDEKISEETNERTFTMFTANFGTSYDFEKETRKWNNISMSVGIPNKIIDFSYSSSFTPYDDVNKLIFPKLMNYRITLSPKLGGATGTFWGGDFIILEGLQPENYMAGYTDLKNPGWNINFNPSYTFSRSRTSLSEDFTTAKTYQLITNARIKFTSIWSISWSGNYSFTDNQFMNHSVNLYCDLECWDLKFDWYPSGFNQGTFYFVLKIKKHPEIKWLRRDTD